MTLKKTLLSTAFLISMVSTAPAYVDAQTNATVHAPLRVAEMAADEGKASPRIFLDVFHDNGLVTEFAVRCGRQRGILTYSRGEQLFCGPQMRCSPSKLAVLSSICQP